MFAPLSGLLLALTVLFILQCQSAKAFNTIAWYYGDTVPIQQLAKFDIVVVNTDDFDPTSAAVTSGRTQYYSYTSVGEAEKDQSYFNEIPQAWKKGNNNEWGSVELDMSAAGYPAFFVSKVVAPLWNRGFRGFFLDTMDSYEDFSNTDAELASQQAGLVRVIQAIKYIYPTANLIMNRGFELMPQVHNLISAIAFESLYQSWDQGNQRYVDVSQSDRNDLLNDINSVRQYNIPLVSIDYCAPSNQACISSAVQKIRAAGFIPYVADGTLQTIGTN